MGFSIYIVIYYGKLRTERHITSTVNHLLLDDCNLVKILYTSCYRAADRNSFFFKSRIVSDFSVFCFFIIRIHLSLIFVYRFFTSTFCSCLLVDFRGVLTAAQSTKIINKLIPFIPNVKNTLIVASVLNNVPY